MTHSERTATTLIGIWLCLPLLGASSVARADPSPAQLVWSAPDGCPSQREVMTRVRARLRAEERSYADWRAVARIVRNNAEYRLELELQVGDEPEAKRVIAGARCDALADAAAVLIALALDPQSGERGATEPPEASPPSASATAAQGSPPSASAPAAEPSAREASPARAPVSSPVPASSPPAAPASANDAGVDGSGSVEAEGGRGVPVSFAFGVGAALRLDLGTLPGQPGVGIEGELGARVDRVHAIATLTFWPPASSRAAAHPTARVRGSAWLGDVGVGYALATDPIRVSPEVRFEYGVLEVEVTRIASPADRAIAWTAAGAGVRSAYRLPSGFELTVDVSGLLPFSRPRTLVRTRSGDAAVFTMSTFLLRFSAGARYSFE